eukprot:TRINITY_DN4514_c1_g1_i6.p1 TRINITY_DN4514_c1_g1~~TRINITY_DN4514_c1_g1_i6.p1  ORF type:complete len:144 (-),score=28.08 TRINITY_DN4514_c1_g1_i6:248-628(-)
MTVFVAEPSTCHFDVVLTAPRSRYFGQILSPAPFANMVFYAYSPSQAFCVKVTMREKIEKDVSSSSSDCKAANFIPSSSPDHLDLGNYESTSSNGIQSFGAGEHCDAISAARWCSQLLARCTQTRF